MDAARTIRGAVDVAAGASVPSARQPLSEHQFLSTPAAAQVPPDLEPVLSPPLRPPRYDWMTSYRHCVIATDLVVTVAVVLATQTLRFRGDGSVVVSGLGGASYSVLSILLGLFWWGALAMNGAWDRKVLGHGASEYQRVLRASTYLFSCVAIAAFLGRVEIARGYLAIALPLGLVGLIGGRWVWRLLLAEHRRAGTHLSTVVVVGGSVSAMELAARLRNHPAAGYRVGGLCVPLIDPDEDNAGQLGGFPIIGGLDNVMDAIDRVGANTVAVAASESFGSDDVRKLAWQLEGTGIRLVLAPALTDVAGPRIHVKPVAGLPLMHVDEARFGGPKLVIKSAMDLVIAGCALACLSPLLLLVAVSIKVSDRGPVFFRQERVGFGGRGFRVWKFRSMTAGAETGFGAARRDAGQAGAVFYKSVADPRITRIGKILRHTSIDELPQLFNVLAGQMSVVGPRPLVPGEGAEIGYFLERRMLVKPGITGLWQVSGRSDASAEERIRLDFYYVENWSVAGDLLIMAKTVRAVAIKNGAY